MSKLQTIALEAIKLFCNPPSQEDVGGLLDLARVIQTLYEAQCRVEIGVAPQKGAFCLLSNETSWAEDVPLPTELLPVLAATAAKVAATRRPGAITLVSGAVFVCGLPEDWAKLAEALNPA